MLQLLAEHSVIFKLQSLVGIPLQFLVSFFLLWLARFKEGSKGHKPHLVIIEEAHMLASEKSRQDIGENILSRMFRTARKRGIALVLCDQIPGELPPAILGNLACRIVMRLSDARSIWSIQSSMGLNRKQAEAVSRMKPRRAVVHYTLHPTPFEIEVPELCFPEKPEEQQLRQEAEDILSKT
jgi:DNA helicase HerA-like ATPase